MEAGQGTSVGGCLRWRAFDTRDRSHSKRSRAKEEGKVDRGTACSSSLADHREAEALTPLGPTMGLGATADEGGGDLSTNNLGPKFCEAKFAIKKYPFVPNAAFLLMNKSQIIHVKKKAHLCKNDKRGLSKQDYPLSLINLTQPAIKPPGIFEILADK